MDIMPFSNDEVSHYNIYQKLINEVISLEFKERLKSLRKERKLTQSALGAILNYGYTAISNYESGRNEPSITDLKKIAEFFDVSMDYLLCVNDIRNPYIERDYPEQFNEFKNIYTMLDNDRRNMLDDFMRWMLDRQIKALSESKQKFKVAQDTVPYKSKSTEN